MNLEKIKAFNNDQKDHELLVAKQIMELVGMFLNEAITHDRSKWSDKEYDAFIDSRDSLRGSADGKDEEYQKALKGEAIQHHITENPHHPEYWDKRDQLMPVHQAIIMYFDWKSRCLAKGTSMAAFWDYNLAKLTKQPHAKVIVECLRREFGD